MISKLQKFYFNVDILIGFIHRAKPKPKTCYGLVCDINYAIVVPKHDL